MRTSSIRAGDSVHANKRERLVHATVVEIDAAGTPLVEPTAHNISYRHLQASDITAHWARIGSTHRVAREPKTPPTPSCPSRSDATAAALASPHGPAAPSHMAGPLVSGGLSPRFAPVRSRSAPRRS